MRMGKERSASDQIRRAVGAGNPAASTRALQSHGNGTKTVSAEASSFAQPGESRAVPSAKAGPDPQQSRRVLPPPKK